MSNKWNDPEYRRAYFAAYGAAHRDKRAAYVKAYRAKNLERLLEKDREYAAAHRAEAAERARAWRTANPERAKENQQRYYAANVESVAKYNRAYRIANAEKLAAYERSEARRAAYSAYIKANPDKNRERGHRRRATIAGRPVERINSMEVYERDGGVCGLCGAPVGRSEFTLDHIVPISKGGAHVYINVHIAHRGCNAKKGAKTDAVIYSL